MGGKCQIISVLEKIPGGYVVARVGGKEGKTNSVLRFLNVAVTNSGQGIILAYSAMLVPRMN